MQCLRWEIISGDKKYPAALQQIAAVIDILLSADIRTRTSLFPFCANTFGALFGTVAMDVSSNTLAMYIRVCMFVFYIRLFYIFKKTCNVYGK